MTQLNEKQLSGKQQIIIILLAVGLQPILYFLPLFLPYPLYVPVFGRFLFLGTILFLAGITLGFSLGWRYLLKIVICLSGTTLILWILKGILVREFWNVLLYVLFEQTIPAAFWAVLGGICGSLLRPLWSSQHILMPKSISRLFVHISIACVVIIVIAFWLSESLSSEEVLFLAGGPMIFVGIIIGMFAPNKAVKLSAATQMLLGIVVLVGTFSVAHGEGAMIIPLILIMIPISIACGVLGSLYGKYLRNHFLLMK